MHTQSSTRGAHTRQQQQRPRMSSYLFINALRQRWNRFQSYDIRCADALSLSPHTSIKSNRIHNHTVNDVGGGGGGGSDSSSIALPDHHIVLHAHYRCTTWRLGDSKKSDTHEFGKIVPSVWFFGIFLLLSFRYFFALYDISRHVSNLPAYICFALNHWIFVVWSVYINRLFSIFPIRQKCFRMKCGD